ncbi:MAG: ATP-dependent DNA helicase RecG [Clostridiales Family XIII bacterium]|jgi:ATP-dependent DNA helicase RecG|nr:ATP-dependent DNA helicase RecG [Clostridiales Family XIII bacterium]
MFTICAEDAVAVLPGIGTKRAERLSSLGINSVSDLLRHYPVRYEDRRNIRSIAEVRDGETALIFARVTRVNEPAFAARGKGGTGPPMRLWVTDGSGVLNVLFFNHRYLRNVFAEGARYLFYGAVRVSLDGPSMSHPDFERIEGGADVKGPGLVPVYGLTAGVTQKMLRNLLAQAIPAAEAEAEVIPGSVVTARHLAPPLYALTNIHFPSDEHALKSARYRLIYEELFLLQAGLFLLRNRGKAKGETKGDGSCVFLGKTHEPSPFVSLLSVREEFAGLLPYALTGAQERAISEVFADMAADRPMARLLQGDVGSGKTAVAMAAALFASRRGAQTLYMAPTEILAAQQAAEFARVFEGTGLRVGYLASGLPAGEKAAVKAALAAGDIDILIGTHALIEEDVRAPRLGLAITDEQHRFGVAQRLRLQEKGAGGAAAGIHVLVMTATPIPRTLAMLLYGDLDASALDEMPPGRQPVETRLIGADKRDAAYDFAEKEMAKGRQVYVVAAMIDETEVDADVDSPIKSANDDGDADDASSPCGGRGDSSLESAGVRLKTVVGLAEELAARFPHRRVGVLHGRLKPAEKDEAMGRFASGEIDLLVSTTVVEVGVNVPNAALMIVENAERFGLAQLHQLRGRVGRGAAKSFCVLISDSGSELAARRGEALVSTGDGFRIAEMDLLLRGPGDLFGVRQHGLPELKIADPARHIEVVHEAGEDVKAVFAQDPLLEAPEHAALRTKLDGTLLGNAG